MEVLIEFGGDFANLENALDDFERKLRKQYPDLKPADKETIGLVEQLTDKIQKLQDLRKKATKIDDVKSYNIQIKESQKQLDKLLGYPTMLQNKFKAIGGTIAGVFAVRNVINFISRLSELEGKLSAIDRRAKAIYGGSFYALNEIAKDLANNMGLTSSQFLDASSNLGLLLKNMNFTTDEAINLSTQLLKTASTLSLFDTQGRTTEQIAMDLGNALAGQTRGLRQYGIVINTNTEMEAMNATTMEGTTGAVKQRNSAQQILNEIMSQTNVLTEQNNSLLVENEINQRTATARIKELEEALARQTTSTKEYILTKELELTMVANVVFGYNSATEAIETHNRIMAESNSLIQTRANELRSMSVSARENAESVKSLGDETTALRIREQEMANIQKYISIQQEKLNALTKGGAVAWFQNGNEIRAVYVELMALRALYGEWISIVPKSPSIVGSLQNQITQIDEQIKAVAVGDESKLMQLVKQRQKITDQLNNLLNPTKKTGKTKSEKNKELADRVAEISERNDSDLELQRQLDQQLTDLIGQMLKQQKADYQSYYNDLDNMRDENIRKANEAQQRELEDFQIAMMNRIQLTEQFLTISSVISDAINGIANIAMANMSSQSEFQKALAVFNVAMAEAQSIALAIQGALQSANATGPGAVAFTPIFIASQIASVLGAFGQIATIINTPTPDAPRFATGVEYLKGPGTTKSDSIPAWLSVGERVTPADINQKYWDELHAIHTGNFENFVMKKYVMPMVNEQLAKINIPIMSIGKPNNWTGSNIVDELIKSRESSNSLNRELIKTIKSSQRISKRKY